MSGSVRDYAILFVGAGKGGGGNVALGGNALLTVPQHRLDGPEHTAAIDGTNLDATAAAHGLLPKLSGNVTDVLRGDGTFAPDATLTVKDEGAALATAATSIDFVGAGVTASGGGAAKTITIPGGAAALDDLTDVVITPPPAAAARLRFDGANWVNSTLTWEPMVDGTGLVMLDGLGNVMRHEVAY